MPLVDSKTPALRPTGKKECDSALQLQFGTREEAVRTGDQLRNQKLDRTLLVCFAALRVFAPVMPRR